MAKKIELKPCPFCGLTITKLICSKYANGRTEKSLNKVTANRFSRMCVNRSCPVYLITVAYVTQELADAAWNTRQPDKELVEALKKAQSILADCWRAPEIEAKCVIDDALAKYGSKDND